MKQLFSSGVLAFWMLLASPQAVFGHAAPVVYEPDAAAVLEQAPASVTIRFSERVEKGASSILMYAPDGTRADAGTAAVDEKNPRVLSVPLKPDAAKGTYTVSWQVVSADDGHFTKGGFGFSVGEATGVVASSTFQIDHRSSAPEAVAIWLELLGQALLIGVLVMIVILRKTGDAPAGTSVQGRLRIIAIASLLLQIVGVGCYLAFSIAAAPVDSPVTLQSFLQTTAGSMAVARGILGSVAAMLLFVCLPVTLRQAQGDRRRKPVEWIVIGLLIVDALFRARVSHAAASTFFPELSILMNAVHLLAKDVWIGGVIVFLLAYVPALKTDAHARAVAMTSLTRVLWIAFGIGGVTGSYIIWLHLKGPANLLATHWGMLCLILVVYGLIFLGSRLLFHFRFDRAPSKEAGFVLVTEAITGMLILFFSGMLIITTPPLSLRAVYHTNIDSQGMTIGFGEHPNDRTSMRIELRGSSVPVGTPVVTAATEDGSIGPIVVPLEQRSAETYVFPVSTLTPPGKWRIDVTAPRPGAYDAVATFHIDAPSDIESPRADDGHGFGAWALACLLAALFITVASILLFRQADRRVKHLAKLTAHHTASDPLLPRWPQTLVMMFTIAVPLVFLGVQINDHGHGWLQRACRENGDYWHESVPMRDGRVLSPESAMGCMFGMGRGQSHIADGEEYAWLLRPSGALASMQLSTPAPRAPTGAPRAGQPVTLTFSLKDGSGAALTDLRADHDRFLHVIVVGRDTQTFMHLHPENAGPVTQEMLKTATFNVPVIFPKAGKYLVAINYSVRAKTVAQSFYVDVAGPDPMTSPEALPAIAYDAKDGYLVTVDPTQVPARGLVRFQFHIEKDGVPVTDLEPYLAATMHVEVTSPDLRQFLHTHGELPQTWWDALLTPRISIANHPHQFVPAHFGPDIVAYLPFTGPGPYIIFGEFQHKGKVIPVRFVVDVK